MRAIPFSWPMPLPLLGVRAARKARSASWPYLLEVTPPRGVTGGPGAAENMLAALALQEGVSLEIAADAEGIRFLARAPSTAAREHLARQVLGQYPQCAITPIDDPARDPARIGPGEGAAACELVLQGPSYLPLRTYRDLDVRDGNDPLLGVLAALAGLDPAHRALSQLVLVPSDRRWAREVGHKLSLSSQTASRYTGADGRTGGSGESAWPLLVAGGLAAAGYKGYLLYQAGDLLHLALLGTGGLLTLPAGLWITDRLRPVPPPDPALLREKAAHRGFVARLRLLVAGGGESPDQARARQAALARVIAAYGPYDLPSGNALVARPCLAAALATPTPGTGILHARHGGALLNAREAASLWHLPQQAADVPGLARGGSRRILAAHAAVRATPSQMMGPGAAIAIGRSAAQGKAVDVCLPRGALGRHTLITGATGTGKSVYLQHLARAALQDPDLTLVLIDPHSDLAAAVLDQLPPARASEAAVLRLGDEENPVGLNLLDAHAGRTPAQVVGGLVGAFSHIWGTSWGPRMEDVFRYALLTLLEANSKRRPEAQYTILDVNPLLTIQPFRLGVLAQVQDLELRRYWRDEYANLDQRFRYDIIKPVLNKLNRFNAAPITRNIMGQGTTTLSVAELLQRRAPLIVDSAMGAVGEDTAALVDATLLDLLACALRERGSLPGTRGRVLVIVDEFQHAPANWASALEGLRKFGASFVLTTQSLAALERIQPGLRATTFANVSTLVCLQTSAEDARYLVPELDEAMERTDLINQPVLHAYVKTTDGKTRLPVFSVEIPLPPPGDPAIAAAAIAASSRRYGRPRAAVEAARQTFLQWLYGLVPEQPQNGNTGKQPAAKSGKNGRSKNKRGSAGATGGARP